MNVDERMALKVEYIDLLKNLELVKCCVEADVRAGCNL